MASTCSAVAFTKKLINVSFSLGQGVFSGGGNSSQVTGLRVAADIEMNGAPSTGTMHLAIWGLPLSLMNQLSTVGTQKTQQGKNEVQVYAGDAESGMSLVYSGLIFDAFVDAQNMPDVCFRLTGSPGGGFHAAKPVPPTSKSGPQDVAGMLSTLAQQMGLQFENNGVNVKITNPYYPSSAWNQALAIAQDANIHLYVERGTMAITPIGKTRPGNVYISRETGMVAYPAFRQATVIVKALFNPSVSVGATMTVKSDLTPANGDWMIIQIIYELDASMPHGRWFMTLVGTPTGGGDPAN